MANNVYHCFINLNLPDVSINVTISFNIMINFYIRVGIILMDKKSIPKLREGVPMKQVWSMQSYNLIHIPDFIYNSHYATNAYISSIFRGKEVKD